MGGVYIDHAPGQAGHTQCWRLSAQCSHAWLQGVTLYRAPSLPSQVPDAAAGGLPPHWVFPSLCSTLHLEAPRGALGRSSHSVRGDLLHCLLSLGLGAGTQGGRGPSHKYPHMATCNSIKKSDNPKWPPIRDSASASQGLR